MPHVANYQCQRAISTCVQKSLLAFFFFFGYGVLGYSLIIFSSMISSGWWHYYACMHCCQHAKRHQNFGTQHGEAHDHRPLSKSAQWVWSFLALISTFQKIWKSKQVLDKLDPCIMTRLVNEGSAAGGMREAAGADQSAFEGKAVFKCGGQGLGGACQEKKSTRDLNIFSCPLPHPPLVFLVFQNGQKQRAS
ncbi:hypothetical protein U0070_007098 [Myodes glareolus]|uniref:Uncharacterized protein n=1 Tax=Myodes glareolus TaxID=447135 RepID=A0AAW0H9X7_MYOGA